MPKYVSIPKREMYNEATGEFVDIPEIKMTLEHSLISVQKWEAKWKKPFLSKEEKTKEEILDYIKCMCIDHNYDSQVFDYIPIETVNEIISYIEDPMTATTFREDQNRKQNEIITSEIIYYWMISYNIPSEYKKWHLNQLLTLCKVCSIKSNPNQKKLSTSEIMSRNRALNAARRKQFNTKG